LSQTGVFCYNRGMKVFAISDLHLSFSSPKPMDIFGKGWENFEERLRANWMNKVGEDDIVLIAGDVSWAMTFENAMKDLEWIAALPGKKVLLRGNHDYWWKSIASMRAAFPPSIYAVQNDCLRFGRLVVCGTRLWTVPERGAKQSQEDEKIYLREAERLKLTTAAAAKEKNAGDYLVCMTHYPPFNSRRDPSIYTERLQTLAPDACVYGHLHGPACRTDAVSTVQGVTYYLTSLDKLNADPALIVDLDAE